MSEPLIVAADAAPGAGLGHVSRAGAVAVALRARGFDAQCVALGAREGLTRDGIDWEPFADVDAFPEGVVEGATVVLDSYLLGEAARGELAAATRLVVFDDGELPQPDNAVLRLTATDDFDHVCLRPQYWGLPRREAADGVASVLVTTGGGDPEGMGAELAAAAHDALSDARVTLVIGPQATTAPPADVEALIAPESLLDPLLDSDIVITAAGQTMLEAAAAGTPAIALPLAPNQRPQARALAESGGTVLVDPASVDAAAEALVRLAGNRGHRAELTTAGQLAVDGYGALRVAFEVAKLHARPTA